MTDLNGNFSEEIVYDKKDRSSEKNGHDNNRINKGRRHKKQVAAFAVISCLVILATVLVVMCFCGVPFIVKGGYFIKYEMFNAVDDRPNETTPVLIKDDFAEERTEIYFFDLKNYNTGDCSLVKVGDTEVLIDAGPDVNSLETIDNYLKDLCTDGKIEYVIVTHADDDHYACFATENGLFSRYKIGTIIDFAEVSPKTDKNGVNLRKNSPEYKTYIKERDKAVNGGAKHFTAAEIAEGGNSDFKLSETLTMRILNNKYYFEPDLENTDTENNHSVCTLFIQKTKDGKTGKESTRNFLFTGDIEYAAENYLVNSGVLPETDVFKAPHHGSSTSCSDEFMKAISPKIVCVNCTAGTMQYQSDKKYQFPSQKFIDRVSVYTARVYVTAVSDGNGGVKPFNGTVKITSFGNEIAVTGSASNEALKNTAWFKKNRKYPLNWSFAKK